MKIILSALSLFCIIGIQPSFSEQSCPSGQYYSSEIGVCVKSGGATEQDCTKYGQHLDTKKNMCVQCTSKEKWDKNKGKCVKK